MTSAADTPEGLLERAAIAATGDLATMLERVRAYLRSHPALDDVARLDAPAGGLLAVRGEPDDTAFVLVEGQLVATLPHADGGTTERLVTAPDLVGELSALTGHRTADLHGGPHGATLVCLGGPTFRQVCEDPVFARGYAAMAARRLLGDEHSRVAHAGAERRAHLEALRLAATGEHGEMLRLLVDRLERTGAGDLGRRTFPAPDDRVIAEGQQLDEVMVILAGTVRVPLPTGVTATAGPGSPLGEIAALSAVPRATASVYVDTAPVEVITVPRTAFAACAGAAVRRLATERLHRTYARRLPVQARESLRTIRDQNADALRLREALDIVHCNTGIFGMLSPADELGPGTGGTIGQKYQLIAAVERLLASGMERPEVEGLAQSVAAEADGPTASRLTRFADAAERAVQRWDDAALELTPADPAQDGLSAFVRRFERWWWLRGLLRRDDALDPADRGEAGSNLDALRAVLVATASADARLALLDERFEQLMTQGLTYGSPRVLAQLRTIRFEELQAEITDTIHAGHELSADDGARRALAEARLRLERGERSAIGGPDYATQRFPLLVLDAIVRGDVPVVVFNGSREAAVRYVRYGAGSALTGALAQTLTTEVQGLDGSGGRSLVTFRDGRQVLVLSGLGTSRQIHNAGSILVYTDAGGRRIPADGLILASEGRDHVAEMRRDLRHELARDEPGALTQLLILQNPRAFAASQPPGAVQMRYAADSVWEFYVALADDPDGRRRRYVIPKVGGRGLYGDTAGDFVTAVFTAGVAGLSPDVVFNGTAGGFAGTEGTEPFVRAGVRGLPDIRPGGLLMPARSIEPYPGGSPIALHTFFADGANDDLLRELVGMGLHVTDDHVAVAAPAIETFDLIRSFLARGKASIDVEGAAIARAVEDLRATGLPVTFTPCYTHSDDPLGAEHNPDESLARMGPFFEGSRLNTDTWAILHRLLAAIRDRHTDR